MKMQSPRIFPTFLMLFQDIIFDFKNGFIETTPEVKPPAISKPESADKSQFKERRIKMIGRGRMAWVDVENEA